MDFDPRGYSDERDPRDSRDPDEFGRDDDDGLSLDRGPTSHRIEEHHDEREDRHDARDRDDHRDRVDVRWADRDRDPRERGSDPRDVFTRGLKLPRGRDREIVHDARNREYTLRGSESRSLATIGAFRVVPTVASQERETVSDPEAYVLYGLLVPPYWSTRSKDPILLQRETESSLNGCRNPTARNREWQSVVDSFHNQNKRVHLLQPLLTTNARYRLIPRAEIEADDARLAVKYPGGWQRRPESLEYAAVSAVGFNEDKSKAILYLRLRDRGNIYFMEKRDGKWVRASIPSCGWIA